MTIRRSRALPYLIAVLLVGSLLFTPVVGPTRVSAGPGSPASVKVATIHFAPVEGDVARNRTRMLGLADTAGKNGAKIIVLPEMATSGYSFFSRAEISKVAETVPGTTTTAMAAIAKRYGAYITFGLPVHEPKTHLYFNSAVLLGPDGTILGTYHKRNHQIESAYNAASYGAVPTFDTRYGRLAIVICSDMFYSQFPREAAVEGADILLAPANTGVDLGFFGVRTYEDDMSMVVANRYGTGTAGTKPDVFTQDSFTIPSPYPYDFNYGSRSIIMTNKGKALADLTAHQDQIGYGDLPVRHGHQFPVRRKPQMYSLIGQDTLEPYTRSQFRQPTPTTFTAAAVDPGPSATPWKSILDGATRAEHDATAAGKKLRLVVFPAGYLPGYEPGAMNDLELFAKTNGVDLLVCYPVDGIPTSTLVTSEGSLRQYRRTHLRHGESLPADKLSDDYLVVDRDYGRVALMQDVDMIPPETSLVLARMGVDVVAMNSDWPDPVSSEFWKSRTGDYLHIVSANRSGPEGIYLGGYKADPPYTEAEGEVIRDISTNDVRAKPDSRFFDPEPLLAPCDASQHSC